MRLCKWLTSTLDNRKQNGLGYGAHWRYFLGNRLTIFRHYRHGRIVMIQIVWTSPRVHLNWRPIQRPEAVRAQGKDTGPAGGFLVPTSFGGKK